MEPEKVCEKKKGYRIFLSPLCSAYSLGSFGWVSKKLQSLPHHPTNHPIDNHIDTLRQPVRDPIFHFRACLLFSCFNSNSSRANSHNGCPQVRRRAPEAQAVGCAALPPARPLLGSTLNHTIQPDLHPKSKGRRDHKYSFPPSIPMSCPEFSTARPNYTLLHTKKMEGEKFFEAELSTGQEERANYKGSDCAMASRGKNGVGDCMH